MNGLVDPAGSGTVSVYDETVQAVSVSILIVSYNSLAVLGPCLDSIGTQTSSAHEIIVVDNASQDGTPEFLRVHYPHAYLVENNENVGFARAVNQAAALARGPYLMLLNPDTLVMGQAVDRLLERAQANPHQGIVAPATQNRMGRSSINSRAFYTPGSLFRLEFAKGPLRSILHSRGEVAPEESSVRQGSGDVIAGDPAPLVAVDAVYGCALMIRADLYVRVGGLDERFFMYEEDIDLCRSVSHLGYGVAIAPDAIVIHHEAGSSSMLHADRTAQTSPETGPALRRARARFLYAQKHFDPWIVMGMRLAFLGFGIAAWLGSWLPGPHRRNTRRRRLGETYIQIAYGDLQRASPSRATKAS
jgi:GT2 family glycosyltransferase